jgi:nicotinate-nucleotide pyrophosphorylase (carboxylating)
MPYTIADHPHVRQLIELALAEDMPDRDITTEAVLTGTEYAEATIRAKSPGVIAGLTVAAAVFRRIDPGIGIEFHRSDGDAVEEQLALASLAGSAVSLLRAERVALNFLQHVSGIATATRGMVKAVAGTGARIVDTRKTTPGHRVLEKYGVRMGGGSNHRFGLSDGVLIKDNHIEACGTIGEAVKRARAGATHLMRIEVECGTLAQVEDALSAGADAILLDNMDLDTLRQAVRHIGDRAVTEASGGVTLATVREIARTGVDIISCGSITHSAPAMDISLTFDPPDQAPDRRLQRTR